jgi:hypothetical protein
MSVINSRVISLVKTPRTPDEERELGGGVEEDNGGVS